jgi:putative NADH-flavin reductase
MKHILLLGATGRTGSHALKYALSKGYNVTALTRNPDKITTKSEKLKVLKGTPTNPEDVREAIKGCDCVVSTLNNPRASDKPWAKIINSPTLMTDSIRNVITAMDENGIKRIVIQTAVGVGDSFEKVPFYFKWFVTKTNLKVTYADHNSQEQLLMNSDLDWTIARPVGLTDKETGKCVKVPTGTKAGPFVMRKNVASFMIDSLASNEYLKKTPTISEE